MILEKFKNISENYTEEEDLVELLLKRQEELNTLLEITQAINRNVSGSGLLEMLELVIKNGLKVEKFLLFFKQDDGFQRVSGFGGYAETAEEYSRMLAQVERYRNPVKISGNIDCLLSKYDYFIPVYHKKQPLAYAFLGETDVNRKIYLKNKLNYIQTLVNVIVVAFENKKLFRERIQKERLQREIELAGEVQNMLIPKKLPQSKGLETYAIYHPHQNVGGDFFDFIELNKDEFLWCIADVSGKGISAALIMANFQASLRALVSTEISLKDLICKLNSLVFRNTEGEKFITLFLGKLNKKTKEIHYINAGHNSPLLIQEKEVIPLDRGTIMIGAFEELPFINEGNIIAEKQSIVFNYTDGILEHDGEENKALSEEELKEILHKNRTEPLEILHHQLLQKIDALRQSQTATDDVTILSFRFT